MSAAAISHNPVQKVFDGSNTSEVKETKRLHSFIMTDPVREKSNNVFWSRVWKFLAITAAIAFIAIAAFTAMSVATLPLADSVATTLFVALLTMPATQFFGYLWNKAKENDRNSQFYSQVIQEISLIPNDKVKDSIRELGVIPGIDKAKGTDEELVPLKKIVAQYRLLQKRIDELKDSAEKIYPKNNNVVVEIDGKSESVNPHDYSIKSITDAKKGKIFAKLQERRAQKLNHESQIAKYKIDQGYLLKIIESPYIQKDQDDFLRRIHSDIETRALAQQFGDANSEAFIVTPQKVYTVKQILDTNVHTLAQEIFGIEDYVG